MDPKASVALARIKALLADTKIDLNTEAQNERLVREILRAITKQKTEEEA